MQHYLWGHKYDFSEKFTHFKKQTPVVWIPTMLDELLKEWEPEDVRVRLIL